MNDITITPTVTFEPRHLRWMLQLAGAYRQLEIVVTLSRLLGCSQPQASLKLKIEHLQRHEDGMAVAEYRTELQHRAEFMRELSAALLEALQRMARRRLLLVGAQNE